METTVLIRSGPKPKAAFPPSNDALVAISPLVAEIFMFESAHTHIRACARARTHARTHARRLDWYNISSPCEPLAQVS